MIIRSKKSFTIISSEVFSSGLSAEAVGVFCFLQSRPCGYGLFRTAEHFGVEIEEIELIAQELQEKGFIEEEEG